MQDRRKGGFGIWTLVGVIAASVFLTIVVIRVTGLDDIHVPQPTAVPPATPTLWLPGMPVEAPMPPPPPPAMLTAFPSDGSGRVSGRLQHSANGEWILNTAVDDYHLLGTLPDEFVAVADGREVTIIGEYDRTSPETGPHRYTPTCIQEAAWLPHGPILDKVGPDCDTITEH